MSWASIVGKGLPEKKPEVKPSTSTVQHASRVEVQSPVVEKLENKEDIDAKKNQKSLSYRNDDNPHAPFFHLSGQKDKFRFFFGHNNPFSQHYMSKFEVDGLSYNCNEQYMMHQKAVVFGDLYTAKRIMDSDDPRVHKKLGRQVRDFDEDKWMEVSWDIVKKANVAKFSQNQKLMNLLKNTGDQVLVEASPFDKIWGIGIDKDHPNALYPRKWAGKNQLGRIMMEVRDELFK